MKFVGSKQRLSKDLVPIIQDIVDNTNPKHYIEPFVGGANVIDKIKHNSRIGYDINHYLIAMWSALQGGWAIPERPTKEEYYRVKKNKDGYAPEYVAIVGYVSTYNAKWFDGYANITTTKTGKVRDYYDEGKRNIEKQLPSVMDVSFNHGSFDNIDVSECLIYCDPPYNTDTIQKDLYGSCFSHTKYYDWVREQSKKNIVLCSEYNMPSDFVCVYEKGLHFHFDNRQLDSRVERLFIHESRAVRCPKCGEFLMPSKVRGYNSYCYKCNEDFGYSWIKQAEEA